MAITSSLRLNLRRGLIAGLGGLVLLETVPRVVDLPRLNMEALNPPYVDSDEYLAF